MSLFNTAQERLFTPPRLKHFCPVEHCSAQCGPGTCKCKPCRPWCSFCRARRALAREGMFVVTDEISLPTNQPRLPGAFVPRSNQNR